MVDRDIVFNLKEATVEIHSNSICSLDGKTVSRQLPLYDGGSNTGSYSYDKASFKVDTNNVVIVVSILILIIGGILLILAIIGSLFSKEKKKK